MRMPLQNEPNAIHGCPASSTAMPGSIALKSSPSADAITGPRSTHSYSAASGSSVSFVASAMTEAFEPKVDAE